MWLSNYYHHIQQKDMAQEMNLEVKHNKDILFLLERGKTPNTFESKCTDREEFELVDEEWDR